MKVAALTWYPVQFQLMALNCMMLANINRFAITPPVYPPKFLLMTHDNRLAIAPAVCTFHLL
jgi:hypothetical protein